MNDSLQNKHQALHPRSLQKIVLIISITGAFLAPFMASALNIALPSIQKDFSANAVTMTWIATAYLLSSSVFLVPMGKIADIYGRARIYRLGIIIFTFVALACALVPSIELLIALRIVQGLAGAMVMTTGMALLTSVFPPQERGKALGLNVSAVYIGLSVGPFVGGILTQSFGWHSIFVLTAVMGVLVSFLTIRYLKTEFADAKDDKLDIPGSIIYALALVALVYGLSLLPGAMGIILIAVSIPGFVLFIKRQLSISNPVFDVRLFKNNRVFAFSNLAALINYCGPTAVTFLLSLYLQYIKALTPQQAGLVIIVQPIVMALLSPYAGRLSDKKEPAIIASIGMTATAAGLFMLSFLTLDTSLPFIIGALTVLGFGFALFSSPNTNAIMSTVERRYYGIASASVATMRLLGQMFSMAVATLAISIFIGNKPIIAANYPAFMTSIHIAFLIFTCLCTAGIFLSLYRGKVHA